MNTVTLNETVQVSADASQVELSVVVGNRQYGTILVVIDGNVVTQGSIITDYVLGSASDLNGKQVIVRSVVNDVNTATNMTTMKYTFDDGTNTKNFKATGEVEEDFAMIGYVATFTISAS